MILTSGDCPWQVDDKEENCLDGVLEGRPDWMFRNDEYDSSRTTWNMRGVPFASKWKIRPQMLVETSSHERSEASKQEGMENMVGGMLSSVSSKRGMSCERKSQTIRSLSEAVIRSSCLGFARRIRIRSSVFLIMSHLYDAYQGVASHTLITSQHTPESGKSLVVDVFTVDN